MAFTKRGGGNLRDGVQDACFLPNGNIVTVGGYYAVTWDSEGKPLRSEPTSMPDGARAIVVRSLYCDVLEGVILGDRLGKVRVLDPEVGEIGYQIDDREDNANVHLGLGRTLVEGMRADGVLAIVSESAIDSDIKFQYWNTLPGRKMGAFAEARPGVVSIDTPPIRGIAMHPTAPVIAIASNAVQPELYDYQMIEELPLEPKKGWNDGAVKSVAFSPSGKFLAAGSEDGRVSIWENHARVCPRGLRGEDLLPPPSPSGAAGFGGGLGSVARNADGLQVCFVVRAAGRLRLDVFDVRCRLYLPSHQAGLT